MRIKAAEYNENISEATVCGINTCTYDASDEQMAYSKVKVYVFDVVSRNLATVEGLSEYTGFERVTTCEEAREYQKLNQEFREMIPPPEEVKSERNGLPVEPALDIETNGIWEGACATQKGIFKINYGDSYCSGVSIAPQWILTAAHCNIHTASITLSYFENNLQYSERNLGYVRFVNPDYSGSGDIDQDIALPYVPELSSNMTKYYRTIVPELRDRCL
jgi:hypothetical protein